VFVSVAAGDLTKISFDLYYKLEKRSSEETTQVVAVAKTGMVCYDYSKKKVAAIPTEVAIKLKG
jgi:acyl-CoA thioesterase FadM